jgi:hypothetical protein
LLLDTPKGADRDVPYRVRNGDATGPSRMFELDVASLAGHFTPTIILEGPDDLPASHVYLYTLPPLKIKRVLRFLQRAEFVCGRDRVLSP